MSPRATRRVQPPREDPFWGSHAAQPEILAGSGDTAPSRWIVANESEGGVQFRIHETQYALPLHVGRLVAYTFATVDPPKLGYIGRRRRGGGRGGGGAGARRRGAGAAGV